MGDSINACLTSRHVKNSVTQWHVRKFLQQCRPILIEHVVDVLLRLKDFKKKPHENF
jgi:hypothetical protein